MEDSIRKMSETWDWPIVFEYFQCKRKVRLKQNKIQDIPSILVKSWMPHAKTQIKDWEHELMFYQHHVSFGNPPGCNAMFLVECPLQYRLFNQWTEKVIAETIVYCPPDWSMHEEVINNRYPETHEYKKVIKLLRIFKDYEFNHIKNAALQFSGMSVNTFSVFTGKEWESETGVPETRLRHILNNRYKGLYKKIYPYILGLPPESDLCATYDLLLNEPSHKKGYRFLRGNQLARVFESGGIKNRVPKFNTDLKKLIRGKHIIECEPVYIVYNKSEKMMDWQEIAEKSDKYREEWYKIRDIVTNAEEY